MPSLYSEKEVYEEAMLFLDAGVSWTTGRG